MENNSLFTTHQLTEYREWPDGRKGCLFYVEEKSAICFIEGKWRELDEVGDYDKLHKWEIENLQEDDVILEGFPASLLSKTTLTSEDDDFARTAWEYYLQKYELYSEYIPEANILTSLFWLSSHWDKHDRDKLSMYFDRRTRYYLNKYLCSTMQEELGKIMENNAGLMLWTHSMFQFVKENKTYLCEYTVFDFSIHGYLGKTPSYEELIKYRNSMSAILAHGFQAAYINYQVACHNIGQILANTSDMNLMAKKMLHGFSEYCLPINHLLGCPQFVTDPKTIPLAEQLSFKYSIGDLSKLYDAYIQRSLYRSRKEEAKDSVIYTFFNNEVENCRQTEWLSQVFNQEQVDDIIHHTMDFLIYYLQKLQNATNYEICKNRLIEVFPSLEEKIEEDKSNRIVDEVSPSFIIPLPEAGNYNALVCYVSERRKIDPEFAHQLDMLSTYGARCEYLHIIIGWLPNHNSLEHNVRSRLKKGLDTGNLNIFPTR